MGSLSPCFVSFWHDAWKNWLCRCPIFPVYFPFSSTPYQWYVRWPVRHVRQSGRWLLHHAQLFGLFFSQLSQRFDQFFLLDLDPGLALREVRQVIERLLNARCLIV